MVRPFGFFAFYYLMFESAWWRLCSVLLRDFQWGSFESARAYRSIESAL